MTDRPRFPSEPLQPATAVMAHQMARALMEIGEACVTPLHEWLTGERQYLLSQGYTDAEARAMSAAILVTVFGSVINRTTDGDNSDEVGP